MYEYAGNLHVHTTYSDGAQPHSVVAASAARAGLDFVVTTDHNVLVQGVEGYYRANGGGKVLLLTGEETHDMQRSPQRNHMLVFGTNRETATAAQNAPPQHLIDAVSRAGGSSYLAHPVDPKVPWAGLNTYSWVDWDIEGFTGLELWNYMSTVKHHMATPAAGVRTIFDPGGSVTGPLPETLALWDGLLQAGRRVAVIGGADAHGRVKTFGPLRKVIYPYEFLFRCVNTHVLLEQPLAGDWLADGAALYGAMAAGRAFVGYGLPGSPRGFRFEAVRGAGNGAEGVPVAVMGDEIAAGSDLALRVTAPSEARLRLICDGVVAAEQVGSRLVYNVDRPGTYRVEAWKRYRGRERGWIFSNPIYISRS